LILARRRKERSDGVGSRSPGPDESPFKRMRRDDVESNSFPDRHERARRNADDTRARDAPSRTHERVVEAPAYSRAQERAHSPADRAYARNPPPPERSPAR
jgi:hypothetical protein